MLLWGMVFFSIAFLYNMFKSTTSAMLASLIGGCAVVAIFTLLFLWTASEVSIVSHLASLCKCLRRKTKVDNIVIAEAGKAGTTDDIPVFPVEVLPDRMESDIDPRGVTKREEIGGTNVAASER